MLVDAVFLGQKIGQLAGTEEPQRRFEHGRDFAAGLEHIDRVLLHQLLEPLGERGLAAADGTQQIEDLALLLEALCGVLEVAHDPLDRVLHAVEAFEGAIHLDRAIEEETAETRILCGIDQLGFADR